MIEFFQSENGLPVAISSAVTLCAVFISHSLQGRVRLIAFSPDSSFFQFDPPSEGGQPILINSGQVILQNQGRIAAEEVEVVSGRGSPPAGYNIVPHVNHTVEYDADGRWKVRFPFIAPKEAITIQILNGPSIENIRCKGGMASYVPVMYQRIYPKWFNSLAIFLMVAGIFSISYWCLATVL